MAVLANGRLIAGGGDRRVVVWNPDPTLHISAEMELGPLPGQSARSGGTADDGPTAVCLCGIQVDVSAANEGAYILA
jgi:hypothetical protein